MEIKLSLTIQLPVPILDTLPKHPLKLLQDLNGSKEHEKNFEIPSGIKYKLN